MSGYVTTRLIVFFIIILAALMLVSYLLSAGASKGKPVDLLKILLFELPVASTSAIAIVYTFFFTDNKLASLPSRNMVSAFTPSLLFAVVVVALIFLSQEVFLPNLAKQKLMKDGVEDVVISIERGKYLVADSVKFDGNKNVYFLRGVELLSGKDFSAVSRYSTLVYNPAKNVLIVGGREVGLNGNLEKVLVFYTDKNYFFSIWEFNSVKDAFFVFGMKTSFLNFIMYEKIFVPVISFVVMVFAITFGWRWRMRRETKLMPVYVVTGAIVFPIVVKMIYYLFAKAFEFLVFPF